MGRLRRDKKDAAEKRASALARHARGGTAPETAPEPPEPDDLANLPDYDEDEEARKAGEDEWDEDEEDDEDEAGDDEEALVDGSEAGAAQTLDAREVPTALEVACPTCGEDTMHDVRKGTVGRRGGVTYDVVATCQECGTTHHALVKRAGEADVHVIVSRGPASERRSIRLPRDDWVQVGDELSLPDQSVQVMGLEDASGLRVQGGRVRDLQTIWARHFDSLVVR
ncbi:MAG TPA: HVO_0476 family zinc finger protein, partial [Candidatus Thermoplasmatota archaeon]|nr:HVO_0476 family zinc finger protein [Candidatus Thermoplasmatota archaeon]